GGRGDLVPTGLRRRGGVAPPSGSSGDSAPPVRDEGEETSPLPHNPVGAGLPRPSCPSSSAPFPRGERGEPRNRLLLLADAVQMLVAAQEDAPLRQRRRRHDQLADV